MAPEYTAKETQYNGILFRSKNEAKWARFFDLVRIKYEYEPVIVQGWNDTRYKPDFYFPEYDKYGEVKSNINGIQNEMMAKKLNGAIDYQSTDVSKGLLLLGSFPYDIRVQGVMLQTKWLFWHKGVCCSDAYIVQRTNNKTAFIAFFDEDMDAGDPLPKSASPDIRVKPNPKGSYITTAINDTNEFFSEGRDTIKCPIHDWVDTCEVCKYEHDELCDFGVEISWNGDGIISLCPDYQ